MTDIGHTPGPWEWTRSWGDVTALSSSGNGGRFVLIARCDQDERSYLEFENQADAKLIAAAPELLAALHETYIALLQFTDDEFDALLERARAAIDRATL